MKKILAIFVLCCATSLANAQENPRPSLSVNGEASVKLAPDQATLPVTVYAEDVKLEAAKAAADKSLKAVLAIAKKFGVAQDKMRTDYTNVQPLYDYKQNNSKPIFRAYAVSTQLSITLDDPSKAAGLMDELTKQGIDRLGSLSFSLKDEKKARDDIMVKAIQDAKAKAERMAGAAGIKLGKPFQISETGGGVQYPYPRPMMARAAMAMDKAEAAPELPSGVIEVKQNVSITFAIE